MNPLKKFLAILLGSAVVLGATIAFADDSATTDDTDEVTIERTSDAMEVETEDAEAESESADAPGQVVPSGDEWTEDYARGLAVAEVAHGGSSPAGFTDRYTAATTGVTTTVVHGESADHGSSDSEG